MSFRKIEELLKNAGNDSSLLASNKFVEETSMSKLTELYNRAICKIYKDIDKAREKGKNNITLKDLMIVNEELNLLMNFCAVVKPVNDDKSVNLRLFCKRMDSYYKTKRLKNKLTSFYLLFPGYFESALFTGEIKKEPYAKNGKYIEISFNVGKNKRKEEKEIVAEKVEPIVSLISERADFYKYAAFTKFEEFETALVNDFNKYYYLNSQRIEDELKNELSVHLNSIATIATLSDWEFLYNKKIEFWKSLSEKEEDEGFPYEIVELYFKEAHPNTRIYDIKERHFMAYLYPEQYYHKAYLNFFRCLCELNIIKSHIFSFNDKKSRKNKKVASSNDIPAEELEIFEGPKSQIFWKRLIQKGFVNEDHTWKTGSKNEAAYIGVWFNNVLRDNPKRYKWKYFEIKWNFESLRQCDCVAKNSYPRNASQIDDIFNK